MTIDKSKDALVIVDLQIDFCPGGALAVPNGDRIVPLVNTLVPKFEKKFKTRDWHPDDHISFKSRGGVWPPHCVAGTRGAEFHPELKADSAIEIRKGTDPDSEAYSGLQGTDLADLLKSAGVSRLFVCGLATDYCVRSTTLDALDSGFEVVVVTDAVRGVEVKPGDSKAALDEMKSKGAVLVESSSI